MVYLLLLFLTKNYRRKEDELAWILAVLLGPELYFAIKCFFALDLNEELVRQWRRRNANSVTRLRCRAKQAKVSTKPPVLPEPRCTDERQDTGEQT